MEDGDVILFGTQKHGVPPMPGACSNEFGRYTNSDISK
jgi:hypothetical protein